MLISFIFCFFFFICSTLLCFFFFFSSRRRHTRWTGDWSSDVWSSDLEHQLGSPLIVVGPIVGDPQRWPPPRVADMRIEIAERGARRQAGGLRAHAVQVAEVVLEPFLQRAAPARHARRAHV